MAINVSNAFIGTAPADGGVLFRAEVGTALPTDAKTALDPAFGDHGAVGEDGVAVNQTRNSTDIRMLGGDVFASPQTEYTEEMVVTLLEDDNDEVLKSAFGDANVEKTEATTSEGTKRTIYHTSDPLPVSTWVADLVSGTKTKRYVVEHGQVISVGETRDVHTDVTRKTLTIKTFKPTSVELKGGNVVEYRNDGVPNPAAGS